uniref:MYND-type domain-containing protein n=1 Tax=Tetradesmus obliquus TaxID=3088 RepID=A0A383VKX9_TETOB
MSKELFKAEQAPQPGCSVAALAAAMLQQMEQSGLLSSMHASLVPLVQAIKQQWGSIQGRWTPYMSVFHTTRALLLVQHVCFGCARELVPAALQHTALQQTMQLLQQLAACGALPPAAYTASGASSSSGSSSRSGSSSSSSNSTVISYAEYITAQHIGTGLIFRLNDCRQRKQLSADAAAQVEQLLEDPAVQGLLLQPLIAVVALLHQHHAEQQQQQRQRQRGALLLHVLPIPPFHQGMLAPGGQAALRVWGIISSLSAPAAAAAAATGAASTGVDTNDGSAVSYEASSSRTAVCTVGESSSSSSSSGNAVLSSNNSGSNEPLKWSHLLKLQQWNPCWAAAVAEYCAAMQPLAQQLGADAEGTSLASLVISDAHVEQQYAAALELCRALAAAAPLPVVCNNPGCDSLAGVSEAAAASKACAGCRCRYCSAACQTADWRRHKRACRLLAAAGEACV